MTNKTPTQFIKHLDIPTEKKKLNKTWLFLKFAIVFFVLSTAIYGGVMFYNTHDFRSPILFQNPVPVKELNIESPVPSKSGILIKQSYAEELTPEEYIEHKFGKYGQIALAVAKAESGLREEAINTNTNGSIDSGIFQINSVHWGKEGCSLKELLEWKKNVDCAYQIFEASGFTPWTVFKSGAYIAKL